MAVDMFIKIGDLKAEAQDKTHRVGDCEIYFYNA